MAYIVNGPTELPTCPTCHRTGGVIVHQWPDRGNDYRGEADCQGCRRHFTFALAVDEQTADLDELECPACGCNDCEILRYPRMGGRSWFNGGEAKCNDCGETFNVVVEDSET